MIYELANWMIAFLDVFCCRIFYESFGKARFKGWANAIRLILLAICIRLVAHGLASHFVLKQITVVLVFTILMFTIIKINAKKSFILAVMYQALLLTVDYITYLFYSVLIPNNKSDEAEYMVESILVVLLGKAILFLFILIIRKQFGKKTTEMLFDIEWVKFLFFPIFTIAIISAILAVFEYVDIPKQANLLYLIAFGMLGMNVVVFYLIHDIMHRDMMLRENQIFQMQVKNQTDMYRSISENLDKQKRRTHEFRNQIICIESLINKKQYEECKNYVQNINGALNEETDVINTNNVIVNAILNTKYQEMTDKGIVFVFRVNDLSKIGISDEDVVTILANLLNNAIEACEDCSGKKIIRLKFIYEEDRVIISVKNTYGRPIQYENDEIVTSKSIDSEEHGIGIKNIVSVINKYNGSHAIKVMEGEFLFSIVIPLNESYSMS